MRRMNSSRGLLKTLRLPGYLQIMAVIMVLMTRLKSLDLELPDDVEWDFTVTFGQ